MSEFLSFSYSVLDLGPVGKPYDPSCIVVSHFIGLDGARMDRLAQQAAVDARVRGHEVKVVREVLQPVDFLMFKKDGELL